MTLATVFVTEALPYTPLGPIFGFSRVPPLFLVLIAVIVILYIISAEIVKKVFYKKVKF